MISVIIPTLNAQSGLVRTLSSLWAANAAGIIKEVIVSDGGSEDETVRIAEEAGARIVRGAAGRGGQMKAAAEVARGRWLLFLHADTYLSPDWDRAALEHIHRSHDRTAGVFRLAFDARGIRPAIVAAGANMRTTVARLPYGDQGLLISRIHYDRVGGMASLPLFEDVEIIRRLVRMDGRRSIKMLSATAVTSADRYERDGYFARVIRNLSCLRKYFAGTPVREIMEHYNGKFERKGASSADHDGQTAAHRTGQDKT